MRESFLSARKLSEFPLWGKLKHKRVPIFFDLEITARCNHNCRHCDINLPAGDKDAQARELSLADIKKIVDEAVSLGALCCLITGGEPLLRDDFFDIYRYIKQKGLLVSVFTNATLVNDEHIELFTKTPPQEIEVSVYGVTKETYERVTRRPGSFAAFGKGLTLLLEKGIKVRLKAMALRSNVHEQKEIARFCRERTADFFRFDPFLNLRYDGDPARNEEIKRERLSPRDIVSLEMGDTERYGALQKNCNTLTDSERSPVRCSHLFRCGAGNHGFTVSYDGLFRLCACLWHPDCVYEIRKGSVAEAWKDFVPKVRAMRSDRKRFREGCGNCPIINLCQYCPASAHLETGRMDAQLERFCEVAHARSEMLGSKRRSRQPSVYVSAHR